MTLIFDLWPSTLKAFSAFPIHLIDDICDKFIEIPPDIESREMGCYQGWENQVLLKKFLRSIGF